MKTREEEFEFCEQLFKKMKCTTDTDQIKKIKDQIGAELVRLYEPFFLHLPSLQQVISAADRDGRKTTVKFTEKAQSKSDKMNENDMSDEKNASDEDSELVEEKEYWDKEDKITESEMKNDFNLRTLYGGYYSTNSFDCYMESVAELFKNYDPSKGHLYPYLLKLFHGKLISKSRSFYYQRLYVLNYPVEIHAEADQNSPVLRTLTSKNYNKEKKDFNVYNVKTTNGERWYRIIHTYQKEKVTGYIKETPNVNFVDSSNSESIEYTNEDGETEERSDISLRQEPEPTFFWEDEKRYLRLRTIRFMAMEQRYLNEKEKSETGEASTSGSFTKYMSYRMLYTEYMILILHLFDHAKSKYEKFYMHMSDNEWMNYFMEEKCNSFTKIINTKRHSYDYFDHKGNKDEISLPAYIYARAPFLQTYRSINRDNESIQQSFSRHKKTYDEMLKTIIEEKIMETEK